MASFKLCFLTKYFWFSLRNNNIGSKGAKFLAEALKMNQALVSLKWAQWNYFLHLPSNAEFNTKTLASLQSNGIEEAGAEALAEVLQCNRKLVTLKWADLYLPFSWFLSCIITVIRNNCVIYSMQKNIVGAGGAKRIADALKTNKTLTELM